MTNAKEKIHTMTQVNLTFSEKEASEKEASEKNTSEDNRHVVIDIKDDSGKPISGFEKAHEVPMHVVVVSNNLQFFDHIHPNFAGNGRFEADAEFPFGGDYTLFCDYQPTGQSEELAVLSQAVEGKLAPEVVVDTSIRKKEVKNTDVSLQIGSGDDSEEVKAGEDVKICFKLSDVETDSLVSDIKPYLGAEGHLVVVKQSDAHPPTIAKDDYIHAHPCPNEIDGRVDFNVNFPKPGKYKLWGQFDRGGQMLLVDFWVEIPT